MDNKCSASCPKREMATVAFFDPINALISAFKDSIEFP
jgi:hypothetical protein